MSATQDKGNKTSPTPIIETIDLTNRYKLRGGLIGNILGNETYLYAVDGVNISIAPGETYGLVGESGSGKSTLGETILYLREPTSGEIRYKGKSLAEFSKRERHGYRRSAQIVLQDPYEAINPRQTIFQCISEPLRNFEDINEDSLRARVRSVLVDVGLRPPGDYLETYPDNLSGGQRQRVNIARALVLEPDFLVADEPLSMLDVSVQAGILNLIEDLKQTYDFALLYISHNIAVVDMISDRMGVMYKGRIVEEGPSPEVIQDPRHPYTQALVRSIPTLDKDRERVAIPDDAHETAQEIAGCSFHPRCPEKMPRCERHPPALTEVDGRKVGCYLYHDRTLDGGNVTTSSEELPK